ncbi:VWA domain-containing protein [Urbifossiella limnaea]|uniref:VWFA domain-containing protein n=1 Tax=Urbifossiella limnaea TaxID=2528023 RepID=A0A517Y0C5_9BACT|nr:VWA domain-containing protein [Urbifossiella limnaea]QDU23209.1 hypothetical protein ETAA1_52010 [Urbifossiella limnaea]
MPPFAVFAVFTPGLAAGAAAAAVAVPFLVHLLFRKRYQIVPWAAIRFLAVAERRHRRRVDHWLLLAARVLALLVALFALAAATDWAEAWWQRVRPGEQVAVASGTRTHHVIVLDASMSMTARAADGPTRFEKAKAQAEELVRGGSPGDGFSVIVVGAPSPVVVPGPSNAVLKVLDELGKLRPTHAAADGAVVLSHVVDALSRSPRGYPRRQVTIFTDAQRTGWAAALPRADAPLPEAWTTILRGKNGRGAADVVVVDVARDDPENLAVVDLALSDPVAVVGSPMVVTATVQNFGRRDHPPTKLGLHLGRPSAAGVETPAAVAAESTPAIPAGGRVSASFTLEGSKTGFLTPGVHLIQVKLETGDDLPADDARAVVVEARDGLHALIVEGKKGEADPLKRAGEYLARALVPPGARPGDTPARLHRPGGRWPETPAERWMLSYGEFADAAVGDTTGADCVYLADVPTVTPAMAARLEAHLKRGGGVVIGLGPNAAAAKDSYNRLLYADGKGILPSALGEVVSAPAENPGFTLSADDAEYRRPGSPLAAFREDNPRAGLVGVPFRGYVKLADGAARRVLSFAPAAGAKDAKLDPAVLEWPRFRGRVVVYASSLNRDWTEWPIFPSYLEFQHELLRFAAANPDPHTARVGDALEEFFPAAAAGLTASVTGPEGISGDAPVTLRDESAVARFADTRLAGFYRMRLTDPRERVAPGDSRDRVFAVNPAGDAESDLKRLTPDEWKVVGPVQVVSDPAEAQPTDGSGTGTVTQPRPHGPDLSRWAAWALLTLLAAETTLAWWTGPARAGGTVARPLSRHPVWRTFGTVLAGGLTLVCLAAVALAVRVELTGDLFGFLPDPARDAAEGAIARAAGVPPAPAGESNRVVFERVSVTTPDRRNDGWAVVGVAVLFVGYAFGIYARERAAAGGLARVLPAALLRGAVILTVLTAVLPQWKLVFKRVGWPEVVIILDTSASMDTVDDLKDAAVRAKAEELVGAANLPRTHRLKLAQQLLTRPGGDWLDRLLTEKRVKVNVFAVDVRGRVVGSATETEEAAPLREALLALQPTGDGSQLGDGVEQIARQFQGNPPAAVVMFTDGVTTAGASLPAAAEAAGVPLYLVGVGDPWVVPDLGLSDLRFGDVVARGDTLDIGAKLASRGAVPPDPVRVTLYEKVGDRLVELGRQEVRPTEAGEKVELAYTPTTVGEKILVLDVPPAPGETDLTNNRVERRVLVTEAKRARVLFVEGRPRYDFRFAKVLLERESDQVAGNKSIEFKTVLVGASPGWSETDRSAVALEAFPTRDELFTFDVVILGDFDPKLLPQSARAMQDLADFVKVKGGGLLVAAGEHHTPAAFADTPVADVLPVVVLEVVPRPTPEDRPLTEGYRPQLTPEGKRHPLFRFGKKDAEAEQIWARLPPLFWAAKGYARKPAAEVLAVHPDRAAEGNTGGKHPLVLQQFAGAGRVVFLGFDETWRWRFRADEPQFNAFWLQSVRALARARRGKPELKLLPDGPVRRGDRITVQVGFPDDAPAPPEGTVVKVRVTRSPLPGSAGEAETQLLVLARDKADRRRFEGVLTRTPEGVYQFVLSDPDVGAAPPSASVRVLPPATERERVDLNAPDLIAAAAKSHGKFYTLATAEAFFADLKEPDRVPLNEPRPPLPLWNHAGVYGLLLLALLGEWLLRKRDRLL